MQKYRTKGSNPATIALPYSDGDSTKGNGAEFDLFYFKEMKFNSLKLLLSRDGKTFIHPATKKPIETMRLFPINGRYMVSVHGHVFDTFEDYNKLKPYSVQGHKFVDIQFKNKSGGVPFLLGEVVLMTFNDSYIVGDKFTYKSKSRKCCIQNLIHIPQGSIRVYPESELLNWECYNKANYANSRVLSLSATNFSITANDVYESLLRTNFKCSYCGDPLLKHKKWHLDHVVPISKNGSNDRTNITPACADCNLMKHNLTVDQFFLRVQKIAHNLHIKNSGNYNILDYNEDAIVKFSRVYIVPSEIID